MSDTIDQLKEKIDAFLASSGMSPTVFGRKALPYQWAGFTIEGAAGRSDIVE